MAPPPGLLIDFGNFLSNNSAKQFEICETEKLTLFKTVKDIPSNLVSSGLMSIEIEPALFKLNS